MHVTERDDRDRPADADIDIVDLEFVADDGTLAGLLRLDLRRRAGATRFLASILERGADPVTVLDHDLPLATGAFEFRASGVWVELCCEEPLDHWTVGLEAFGLALPPDSVVTPDSFGDRVPLGLDLDLDTVGAPEGDAAGFSLEVRVHGEVLVADRAYEIDAVGRRTRSTARPRPMVVAGHPPVLGELTVAWPEEDGLPFIERRGWFAGSRPGWTALAYEGE